jgi:hypothetical protein
MVQKRVQKGDSHLLCEAPFGPFRQKVAVTFLNHAQKTVSRTPFSVTEYLRKARLEGRAI